MRSFGLRTILVVAVATLSVVASPLAAIAQPNAEGDARATQSSGLAPGAWVTAAPRAGGESWARSNVLAGAARDLSLTPGRSVPRDARSLVVQVQVEAADAGTVALWTTGATEPADPAITFAKGTSAATTLVTVDAERRLTVRSSVAARVAVSVVGYLAGGLSEPGPGGTKAVTADTVIDQGAALGGSVPAAGGSATVPLAGIAQVPSVGVRAVWLSVQAQGRGAGGVSFAGPEGNGREVSTAAFSTRWTTSLVLAPVDDDGDLTYTVRGASTTALVMTVVGWVAETGAGQTSAVTGGIVPIVARAVSVPTRRDVLQVVDLAGEGVPTSVEGVLVRATVSTGSQSGSVGAAASVLGLLFGSGAVVPVAARTDTAVTAVLPTNRSGKAYVRVPSGARITSLVVLGYQAAPVSRGTDTADPSVAITTPAQGAQLEQAESPEVTISGTAADPGSGIMKVSVTAGGQLVGEATVRSTGSSAQRWSLTTGVPAGDQTISVTATDWSGRSRTVSRDFTVLAAAPDVVVVDPDTHVLDAAEEGAIASVADGQLVFDGVTSLRAGDVVVSGVSAQAPEGLLRRVLSVELVGATSVVLTGPAALTDVLLQADIHLTDVPLDGSSTVVPVATDATDPGARAAGLAAMVDVGFKFVIAPAPLSNASGSLKVGLSATVGVKVSIDLVISLDVSFGGVSSDLTRFSYVLSTEDSVGVTASATESVLKFEREKALKSIRLGAATLMAGPVPVVFTFTLDPTLSVSASMSAALTTSYDLTLTARTGMTYENGGWTPVNEKSTSAEPSFALKLGAEVGAAVKFAFGVKIYDLAGPYVALSVGPTYSVSLDLVKQAVTTTLSLDYGLSVGANVRVLSWTLADAHVDLGSISWILYEKTVPLNGGFGLADAHLDVCLPTYEDTIENVAAVSLGQTEDGRGRKFRVTPRVEEAIATGEPSVERTYVVIEAPALSPSASVVVMWDFDPASSWGQHYPQFYSEQAVNQSYYGSSTTWRASVSYVQLASLRAGYTGFTVYVDGVSAPALSAVIELQIRTQLEDLNERYCGSLAGQKIADGEPAQSGLHWDALHVGSWVQLSLEADQVPTATASVIASCTVTDNHGSDWPEVGSTRTEEMLRADSYQRWTERFETDSRDTSVFLVSINPESDAARTCKAVAYDADGGALRTYNVIAGDIMTPMWQAT